MMYLQEDSWKLFNWKILRFIYMQCQCSTLTLKVMLNSKLQKNLKVSSKLCKTISAAALVLIFVQLDCTMYYIQSNCTMSQQRGLEVLVLIYVPFELDHFSTLFSRVERSTQQKCRFQRLLPTSMITDITNMWL